jgi:NADH-quinone oxidoreductase subunit L
MLALIGFPFLAGFFSKDYVLEIAYQRNPAFYWVGVVTAFLTAFYMTRLVVVAFFGRARTKAAEHPHESPANMTVPLILLSILSVIGGFIGLKPYYHGWATSVLQTLGFSSGLAPESGPFLEMIVPSLVVLLGLVSAFVLYWGADRDPLHIQVLASKFYFDDIYDNYVVAFQQVVARVFSWVDSWLLEGLLIRGSAYVSVGFGELMRLFQTGSLSSYAFLFTLGGVILIWVTLFTH